MGIPLKSDAGSGGVSPEWPDDQQCEFHLLRNTTKEMADLVRADDEHVDDRKRESVPRPQNLTEFDETPDQFCSGWHGLRNPVRQVPEHESAEENDENPE